MLYTHQLLKKIIRHTECTYILNWICNWQMEKQSLSCLKQLFEQSYKRKIYL